MGAWFNSAGWQGWLCKKIQCDMIQEQAYGIRNTCAGVVGVACELMSRAEAVEGLQ
jgi:hypothetical protein